MLVIPSSFVVLKFDPSADSGAGSESQTFSRIFELLSIRRILDAVHVAEEAGLYRLATLLSQVGGDDSFSLLMDKQLHSWAESGASAVISVEVINLYRLLAGQVFPSDLFESGLLLKTDWTQSLAILYFYCLSSVSKLGEALHHFKEGLVQDVVPIPMAVFGGQEASGDSGVFSVLEALFEGGEGSTVKALSPLGYTHDPLDYRHSYILLLILESLGLVEADASCACVTRQHFISELFATGCWEWALLVTSQQQDEVRRASQMKEIILRFLPLTDPSTMESVREFLHTSLLIPSTWTAEALGYAATNPLEKVQYFLEAECFEAANEVISFELAAEWIFSSSTVVKPLLDLLALIESRISSDDEVWRCSGSILLEYYRLLERYESFRNAAEAEPVSVESLMGLYEVARRCEHNVTSLRLDWYKMEDDAEPTLGIAAKHAINAQISELIEQLEAALVAAEQDAQLLRNDVESTFTAVTVAP